MGFDLAAAVVNYRTSGDVEDFLRSWTAVSGEVDAHLTIVNVCPLEEDEAVVSQAWQYLDHARTSIVAWRSNCGYNVACNRALARGASPYLACFNADVVLRPGVLRGCVDAIEEHSAWAVVGPRQVDDSNRITCAGTLGTPEHPEMRGWMQYDQGQFSDVRDDCVHVSGSAMFWRRSVWEELTECPQFQAAAPGATGALLPAQHFYGETWAMYHARAHGHRVGYLGTVVATHRWHRASPVGRAPNVAEDQAFFRRACQLHEMGHD